MREYAKTDVVFSRPEVNELIEQGWELVTAQEEKHRDQLAFYVGLPWRAMAGDLLEILTALEENQKAMSIYLEQRPGPLAQERTAELIRRHVSVSAAPDSAQAWVEARQRLGGLVR